MATILPFPFLDMCTCHKRICVVGSLCSHSVFRTTYGFVIAGSSAEPIGGRRFAAREDIADAMCQQVARFTHDAGNAEAGGIQCPIGMYDLVSTKQLGLEWQQAKKCETMQMVTYSELMTLEKLELPIWRVILKVGMVAIVRNLLATQCPPVPPFNDAGMPDPGIDGQPKNKAVGLRPVERTIPRPESGHACSSVTTTSINMSRFLGPSAVLSKKSRPTTPW
ncbi:hypothetical protein TNCV_946241 [Trichonephila clavipes]|nr:hypothetical protein TNCV_946241 [Trichonephila clavipes]